jgi:hypothetical protein
MLCEFITNSMELCSLFLPLAYLLRHVSPFHIGLGPLRCFDSKFDFWNLWIYFWIFGKTPWTGDRPVARPLPTQDSTTQKNADTHPCFEQDSNARSQCSSGWRPRGHWDRLKKDIFGHLMTTIYLNSRVDMQCSCTTNGEPCLCLVLNCH